ncbi:MAG: type III-B CRISPR module RAMP protein Cmr6 [Clostridia bacterium]|nr:MAG: type III-B CRISPR module RAMP protein Cmr6 [Clostridia bacterium]
MTLPLYRDNGFPGGYLPRDANAGLWYDKFCDRWQVAAGEWSLPGQGKSGKSCKSEWIGTVTGTSVGDGKRIVESVSRLAGLVAALGGQVRFVRTVGRFVTGMGREHPVENGFAWHHTLGTPFLPGTSVKGVTRAWATSWWDGWKSETEKQAALARVFGPEHSDSKASGSVIFFDLLPAAPVKLEADVMTPHYQDYYREDTRTKPPADWDSPIPVPFLTVVAGQLFVVAVAPRRQEDAQARQDAAQAGTWLLEALEQLGAGAKTSVGYGCFRVDQEAERSWQEEKVRIEAEEARAAALAAMSPVRLEMEQDGYSGNPDRFMESLSAKWLARMDSESELPVVRREIAQLLADWYRKYRPDQWERPRGKNEAKVNRIRRALEPAPGETR